ncbi:hypothetical protein KJ980_01785 [Patescibacteria group bacterium]|nr:hypothetical protein [Patescibacteria group bacterium]MBU4098359.1 hypothetical protein [Patescibacteria group bacterium]
MAAAELSIKRRPKDIGIAAKDVVKSPEANNGTFKFTPEAKAGVEGLGRVVFTLTGKSIEDYKKEGMLQPAKHSEFPVFEAQPSINSEIAINLKEIFLPKSNNKGFSEQKAMVKEHSKDVKENKKVEGVKAFIGNAPTNLGIIKNALELSDKADADGIRDLLREGSVRCAEASPLSNKHFSFGVTVGYVNPEGKFLVTLRDTGSAKQNVHLIDVLVPEDLPVPVEEPVQGEEPVKLNNISSSSSSEIK